MMYVRCMCTYFLVNDAWMRKRRRAFLVPKMTEWLQRWKKWALWMTKWPMPWAPRKSKSVRETERSKTKTLLLSLVDLLWDSWGTYTILKNVLASAIGKTSTHNIMLHKMIHISLWLSLCSLDELRSGFMCGSKHNACTNHTVPCKR